MTRATGGREGAAETAAGFRPFWPPRSYFGQLLLVVVGYYVAARLSLQLSLVDRVVTPIWPPTGIALVALLGFGPRVWPAITLAAFLVNGPITGSLLAATAIATGNTLAPLLAAHLLRMAGFRRELDRLRDALVLVFLGALLAMTVSASFGAGALWLSGAIPTDAVAATWAVWWAGDATGILVFAPLLLSLRRLRLGSWRRAAEAAVLFPALATMAYLVFRTEFGRPYLVFPFVIWAAVRFGQRGASVAALLVVGMAVWAAVDEAGPFARLTLLERALTLQIYNAGAVLTSFFLAAVMTERMKAQAGLEQAAAALEERVRERTADLAEANRQLEAEILQRREGEETFRLVFETATVGFAQCDPGGRIQRTNRAYQQLLGFSGDELQGVSLLEIAHPEDRGRAVELFQRMLDGHLASFEAELRQHRKDGEWISVHTSVWLARDADGRPRFIHAVAQDLTERRRAEALARAEAERGQLEEVFQQAPAAIAVLRGPDHLLEFANPAFHELVGGRARAGRPIREVVPELERQGQLALLDRVYGTGEAFVAREALVRFDRAGAGRLEEGYFNITCQPLRGQGGDVDGVLVHAVEVTEMVRTRQEVQALLDRERRIAETLQRSLLPEQLPEIPGVALAGRYLPGAAGLEVGGDWYDVFLLPGGRVGLSIGDVVGRGLPAAAAMGQLRTALRAYALEATSPAAALERLSRLVQELEGPQMATIVYAVLDPETGRLGYASAGHPPPLLAGPDRIASYLEEGRSPPLGVPGDKPREAVVVLEPGSTLLLYTDGLVERRGGSIEDGLEALRETMAGPLDDLDSLCDDRILRTLRPDAPADDVALLALRLLPVAGDQLDLTLPAEPAVLASVRRALGQWLGGMGASPEEVHDLVLACNEAATNVLEHAYGPGEGLFEIKATRSADGVSLAVRDWGQWRSPRGSDRGRGLVLMHALVDSVEVVPGPAGTEVRLHRQLGRAQDLEARPAAAPQALRRWEPSAEELVQVIRLEGDIDVRNAQRLRGELVNAVGNEALGLVVDLSDARHLDSAGVRLLFQLAGRLAQRRQQLGVVVPEDSPIRRVLLLTRLETSVLLTSTVEEATARVRSVVGEHRPTAGDA